MSKRRTIPIISEPVQVSLVDYLCWRYGPECSPKNKIELFEAVTYELLIIVGSMNLSTLTIDEDAVDIAKERMHEANMARRRA